MRNALIFILALVFSTSCTKHVVVDVDNPPIDSTITAADRSSFVNGVYIALLGRKPLDTEFDQTLIQLEVDPYSEAVRRAIVQGLQSEESAAFVILQNSLNRYLDGTDTAGLRAEYNYCVNQAQNAGSQSAIDYWTEKAQQFFPLLTATEDLHSATLTYVGLQKYIIDNRIYDQINMGTENFVVSAYNNYYLRYPSATEQADAITMVNGYDASLYGVSGKGKADFIDVFFDQTEFYQGIVVTQFEQYLLRQPTTYELYHHTQTVAASGGDWAALQLELLGSYEYIKNK